jgi:hypothetical protein
MHRAPRPLARELRLVVDRLLPGAGGLHFRRLFARDRELGGARLRPIFECQLNERACGAVAEIVAGSMVDAILADR